MYEQGTDLPKDPEMALYWYRQSAEQGYTDAQLALAILFANGQGVKVDLAQAHTWFHKAAEAGNSNAQFNLGTYMAHGIGTAKDLPSAAFWLSRAALQGKAGAAANRDYVVNLLSPQERDELERRLKTAANPQHQDKQATIR